MSDWKMSNEIDRQLIRVLGDSEWFYWVFRLVASDIFVSTLKQNYKRIGHFRIAAHGQHNESVFMIFSIDGRNFDEEERYKSSRSQ